MDQLLLALISALVGATFIVIGQVVTHRLAMQRDALRTEAEQNRWRADYFLPRKYEALTNLYIALVDCFEVVLYTKLQIGTGRLVYSDSLGITEHDDMAKQKENALWRASLMGTIYLSTEENTVMRNTFFALQKRNDALRRAHAAFIREVQAGSKSEDDFQSVYFDKEYDSRHSEYVRLNAIATGCLKAKLNPQLLERIEGSHT